MGLLDKVQAARTAKSSGWRQRDFWDVDSLGWPSFGGTLRSDREQVETSFEGYVNGVLMRDGPVAALMFVRLHVFAEARFQFRQMRNGRPGNLFGTQDLALLEKPWPGGTTGDLLARMIMDADLAGNSYWTPVNGHLRRLRPDWVTIISASREHPEQYGAALDAEILGYLYSPQLRGTDLVGGTAPVGTTLLLPDQVAHFAPIPDPLANWRGMSWVTPVLREVSADLAATLHKTKFFEHGATPQLAVKLDASVTPEMFARFKALMDEQHGGVDNAYKTLYLGGGADVTPLTMDLKQLDFKATQGAGETRLAALIPAVAAGLEGTWRVSAERRTTTAPKGGGGRQHAGQQATPPVPCRRSGMSVSASCGSTTGTSRSCARTSAIARRSSRRRCSRSSRASARATRRSPWSPPPEA
ncbi:phage portal protein [Actinomadura nitritigenes]|uniref:phage portal protein n=1 Tax=Actinomadura nitritigenes TaxID=134602 RepID=UPI003D8BC3F6